MIMVIDIGYQNQRVEHLMEMIRNGTTSTH